MIVEQRSPEWYDLRKGKITSSEVYKLMGRDALTETAKTYLLEKVSELYGGESEPISAAALEWGTQLEPLAIDVYSEKKQIVVEKASFLPYNDSYGGSPDGIVQPKGIIEVKCPHRSINHFKHRLINSPEKFKKVAPNYYYQCISNMICANATWCDFISYDPRVDEEFQLYVFKLELDPGEKEAVLERVQIGTEYMETLKKDLLASIEK